MIYVIGSGPAGVSAATALVNKGLEVTLLDAGFELEPERAKLVHRLSTLDRESWEEKSISMLKENMSPNLGGVDLKYIYGSDYPYRGIDYFQPVELGNAKMARSLAKGGFSNVWGGAILPFRGSDIDDWPISIEDLEPHYKAVLSFMPYSGRKDRLKDILPLYSKNYQNLHLCRQSFAFLHDMESNKESLESEGFLFGYSRLAVEASSVDGNRGCIYCGLCLYGCPYGLIYSTTSTLAHLSKRMNFRYHKDVLVEKLIESNGKVIILAKTLSSSEELKFRASRVYLASGPLSSTRIILHSLGAFDRPVKIRHSEHFQIPLIRYKKMSNLSNEDLHTLSQIFIEILDRTINDKTIHMQVYAYNDLYISTINNILGPLATFLKHPVNELIGRLLIIKGYLHSSISSHILVRLMPGKEGKLLLETFPNNSAKIAVRKIATKFIKNRKYLRGIPLPKIKIGAPGTGNHSGGSFPMRKKPSEFEADVLGRPYGFERIHVVDSTIFPSIPATTITLSIMANAHRIASAN